MTAVLFMVGQLLVADSVVVQWAGNLNPQLQMFVRLLTTWLEEHPEISVRTTQNILFHYYSIFRHAGEHFCAGHSSAIAGHAGSGQQRDHYLFVQGDQPRRLFVGKIFHGFCGVGCHVAGTGLRGMVCRQSGRAGLAILLAFTRGARVTRWFSC